jgi:hypothetical protein
MVTTFRVEVNPFIHTAIIDAKIDKQEYRAELEYGRLDFEQWMVFTMGDNVYDILFIYDDEFIVKIEDAQDGTEQIVKVKISFK